MKFRLEKHKLLTLVFLQILLLLPFTITNAYSAQNDVLQSAEATINQYFTALANGEVGTIRTLLAPKLSKQRARLLSNPVYGGKLREIYRNSTFAVTGRKLINKTTVAINVKITFSTTKQSTFRFILKRIGSADMRISKEIKVL